jgi:predicted nucleic acid-binding Zn ribbon protein
LYSAKNYATKTRGATTTFVRFWDGRPPLRKQKPTPVSELLVQGKATLERLKTGAEAANRVLVAVQQALPADVIGRVWGASLDRAGVLTLVTDRGSWASRLRYALPEVAPRVAAALGERVVRTVVRVRPRPS